VAPCETPPPFFLTLRGEERLNQDALGRSLPTLVRVLQLKSTARLEELEATELWQRGEERLAADLVASEELTVSPGEAQERWVSRSPGARVVVLAGLFRQPSGTSWRSLQVLPGVPADLCRTDARALTDPPGGRDVRLGFVLEDFAIRAEAVRSSSAER
jgi:type VI secretion system protein VasD